MTDYISTLKKMLSDELERVANDSFGREYSKWNKEEKRPFNYNESFRHGHEAATERLLPVLEQAVELLVEVNYAIGSMYFFKLIQNIDNPSFEDSRIEWIEIQIDKRHAKEIREFLAKIEEMK